MTRSGLWVALKPWAGLVAAVIGAGVAHQFGADATFDDCLANSPGPLLAVATLCILVVLAAGWASGQVARLSSEAPPRRLVAFVSVGMAALALFAIVLPMIASLTLPPCFR